ncbi:MAG: DUF6088 family protein [Ferruginibacter sp.]
MARINYLRGRLKPGEVYRRSDLANWSKSVDRHLEELVADGTLEKLSQGVYYVPKKSAFGKTPPDEKTLVQSFLKDDRFLLTSNNAYNSLGLGTTQLYNEQTVYNHKRHGKFKLGNRTFSFKMNPHFPKKLTKEFLVVDLVNNLKDLAEDQEAVLQNLKKKIPEMDKRKLQKSVDEYGNVKTKKIFAPLIHP